MGYGKWEDIRQEIQKCQEFQFDWFFRTRSAPEIQRRCDVLIRAIEKEAENSLRGRGRASEKRESDEDDAEMKKEEKKNMRKRRKKMTKPAVKKEENHVECSCLFQFRLFPIIILGYELVQPISSYTWWQLSFPYRTQTAEKQL